jgi:hypothetical protein
MLPQPKTTISCKKAAHLLSESFERELSLSKKLALRTHLAICKTCVSCARQFRALKKIFSCYNKAATELPPPSCCCLPDDAKERIKAALAEKKSCPKKS